MRTSDVHYMRWYVYKYCMCLASLKVHKHEIFFLTFFAETETLWSQGPVTRDFWKSYSIRPRYSTCVQGVTRKCRLFWLTNSALLYEQGCEWNAKSLNRERESRPRIGSDATFFWDSCSNLEIDDNFRISHNLGLGLAANISTALAIQPDRYRERQ